MSGLQLAEEDDLDPTGHRNRIAMKGRRAGKVVNPHLDKYSSLPAKQIGIEGRKTPPSKAKTGGWADEDQQNTVAGRTHQIDDPTQDNDEEATSGKVGEPPRKSSRFRRKASKAFAEEMVENIGEGEENGGGDVDAARPAQQPHIRQDEIDSDSDIPIIPDLEDVYEEELVTQVAVAPTVAVNRVATYRELDNELLKQTAFLALDDDTDLSILTKVMSPLENVQEEDRNWDWDLLFTEVVAEIAEETRRRTESESANRGKELSE